VEKLDTGEMAVNLSSIFQSYAFGWGGAPARISMSEFILQAIKEKRGEAKS